MYKCRWYVALTTGDGHGEGEDQGVGAREEGGGSEDCGRLAPPQALWNNDIQEKSNNRSCSHG